MDVMSHVTIILNAIESGEARTEDLLPLVYDELRRIAAAQMQNERAEHSLQATALVHEAFLRLTGDEQPTWQNRRHFFGAAALAMQRILVEQARRRKQLKRGGDWERVELVKIAVSGAEQRTGGHIGSTSFAHSTPDRIGIARDRQSTNSSWTSNDPRQHAARRNIRKRVHAIWKHHRTRPAGKRTSLHDRQVD
jgi:hypothetical protein